ncbi:Ms5788A family Cys-rich leader peptide [Sporichthya sp.]
MRPSTHVRNPLRSIGHVSQPAVLTKRRAVDLCRVATCLCRCV